MQHKTRAFDWVRPEKPNTFTSTGWSEYRSTTLWFMDAASRVAFISIRLFLKAMRDSGCTKSPSRHLYAPLKMTGTTVLFFGGSPPLALELIACVSEGELDSSTPPMFDSSILSKTLFYRFPRDLAWGNGYENAKNFRAASGGQTNSWFWVFLEKSKGYPLYFLDDFWDSQDSLSQKKVVFFLYLLARAP